MANANRWAPLAATVDDPKPQRPSKKQPAAASLDASAGQGVPPATINRAAAAAFPSPYPSSSNSGDFPALPGNPPAPSHTRLEPALSATAPSGAAPVAAASQRISPAQGAMPTVGQAAASSQTKSAPATHPKSAPNKADWGYLSSERQKDKARSVKVGLIFGSKSFRSGTQHGGAVEERVRGIGETEQGSVSAVYLWVSVCVQRALNRALVVSPPSSYPFPTPNPSLPARQLHSARLQRPAAHVTVSQVAQRAASRRPHQFPPARCPLQPNTRKLL